MFEADAIEFPFLADVPKAPSKLQRVLEVSKKLSKAIDVHGDLVPRDIVAKVVGISRQRVHQLVEEGKITQVDIDGYLFVTQASLVEWVKEERKGGRPPKIRGETLGDAWKAAVEITEEQRGQK